MRGSRNFCKRGGGGGGGGGVEARRPENNLFFLFLNLLYSLQRGSNGFVTEGGPTFFKRGSNFFEGGGGGPNVNFFRNPYNL